MQNLSVLTLNVWNREGPWPERLALIRSCIGRLRPDLIGLQEVVDPAHADELLGGFGYHVEHGAGISVASRWPAGDRREQSLPGTHGADGGPVLRVRVQSPYGVIPFTCATTAFYLTHHGYRREQQMPALNEFARGRVSDSYPAILVGDFNTDPESAEIRFLKGLQSLGGTSAYWCDAWEHGGDGSKGATWSHTNAFAAWAPWPDRRIDYIFVAQPRLDHAGTVVSCELAGTEETGGVWPSDHFGVFARLSCAG